MSQIVFRGKESHWKIVVGWDNPLETFFAQVWDERRCSDDYGVELVLCVGTFVCEVASIEELEYALAPFGELSEEHKAALEESYARRTPPTPAQLFLRTLIM